MVKLIESLGLVKTAKEMLTSLTGYTIDIREPEAVSLKKWNLFQFKSKIYRFHTRLDLLFRLMSANFPNNQTFELIYHIVAEYFNDNEDEETGVNIAEVIRKIYEKVNELCTVKPPEFFFDFTITKPFFNAGLGQGKTILMQFDGIESERKNRKKRRNKPCSFCGVRGPKMELCKDRKNSEALKQIESLLIYDSFRAAVVASVRADDDLFRRVTVCPRD